MNDPRIPYSRVSHAMRQLDELADDDPPSRWEWMVVRVEPGGRLILPGPARNTLGLGDGAGSVAAVCHPTSLVLGRDASVDRVRCRVDARGRLRIPVWLRRDDPATLLVGTDPTNSVVVVANTRVLDAVGDSLVVGEER